MSKELQTQIDGLKQKFEMLNNNRLHFTANLSLNNQRIAELENKFKMLNNNQLHFTENLVKNNKDITELEQQLNGINSVDDNRWETMQKELNELKESLNAFRKLITLSEEEFKEQDALTLLRKTAVLFKTNEEITELKEEVNNNTELTREFNRKRKTEIIELKEEMRMFASSHKTYVVLIETRFEMIESILKKLFNGLICDYNKKGLNKKTDEEWIRFYAGLLSPLYELKKKVLGENIVEVDKYSLDSSNSSKLTSTDSKPNNDDEAFLYRAFSENPYYDTLLNKYMISMKGVREGLAPDFTVISQEDVKTILDYWDISIVAGERMCALTDRLKKEIEKADTLRKEQVKVLMNPFKELDKEIMGKNTNSDNSHFCSNCKRLNDMEGVFLKNINLCDVCVDHIFKIVLEGDKMLIPREDINFLIELGSESAKIWGESVRKQYPETVERFEKIQKEVEQL